MATASVRYGSILERNKWTFEKLDELKSKSFCAPYIGTSFSSVVQQTTDVSKKDGHEVRFQFDGNLISAPIEGSDTAFGKGESKKVFSDSARVKRVRFPVDNGDKFEAANIDASYLTEHEHSMELLGDKWIRFKDQAIFDVAQQSATHRIVVENALDLTTMGKIKTILASGIGYVSMTNKGQAAPRRRPLAPYKLANGEYVYLFLVDSFIAQKFLKDSQSILAQADVRGADNMVIKGVIGKIHNMLIVEAPVFFGESRNSLVAGDFVSADGYARLGSTDIEVSGLRQFFSADGNTIQGWSGQTNLVTTPQNMWSRGVILGAGAIHYANGLLPRYSVKFSQDFDITSQSCLETWVGFRAVKLLDENGDYPTKMAGVSHGIVAVDIKIQDSVSPFGLMLDAYSLNPSAYNLYGVTNGQVIQPYVDGHSVPEAAVKVSVDEDVINQVRAEVAAEYEKQIAKLQKQLDKAKAGTSSDSEQKAKAGTSSDSEQKAKAGTSSDSEQTDESTTTKNIGG